MSSQPTSDLVPILKRLNAAIGYLNLGMPDDAWNELEDIEAKDRARPEVLKLRVEVCRALESWETMAEVSNQLRKIEPDEVGHPLNMSHAVRRFKGEAEAADILSLALRRYYDDALVRYNLACYWCVIGRIEEAREMLETAFKKDQSLRELAETDEDLAALRQPE
jgi:tetratricopeptide (TPR) repeat protein